MRVRHGSFFSPLSMPGERTPRPDPGCPVPAGPSPLMLRLVSLLVRLRPLPTLLLLCGGLALSGAVGRGQSPDDVGHHLRTRIEAIRAGATDAGGVGANRLLSRRAVGPYDQQAGFEPAWTGPDGPTSRVDSLLAVLRDAPHDGLRAADYHVPAIDALTRRLRAQVQAGEPMDARARADLDLLCTDAFLLYGAHLLRGRVDPVKVVPTWNLERRQQDLVEELRDALANDAIRATLHRLRPPQPAYAALRRALARYRAIAERGGWPTVPDGPTLREGVRDERLPLLHRRLQTTGDLAVPAPPDALLFDHTLRRAVARFQERHGLEIDGVVGPATRAAMNVPVEARIRQIEVNMERGRWLPRTLGDPHVAVNIADFWLRVVEGGRPTLQMRVVVGTRYRRTPIFSDAISYLVLNPYWHVPHRIAVEDKLLDFRRDPALVARLGVEVFDGWGSDAAAVDPSTISWDRLSASNFPYRLRQRPGPANALGEVKFMFPNAHDIYLHDTPSRLDFRRALRPFSSGCIRVEYPVELALYLLRHNDGWTEERVRAVMASDTEQTVVLRRTVPVHLLYWTAWMEDADTLHFRADVYQRDEAVAAALAAPPSPPPALSTVW